MHFPVYRTYLTASGPSREDRAIIDAALARARADWFGSDIGVFDFLRDALTLDLVAPGRIGHSTSRNRHFAFKVQQFTGPMMAKSLEDTAFYRYHRLLALNEVGGDAAASGLPVTSFHERMRQRATKLPHGLTATATHDTKRGEDARTRLIALSELADEWTQHMQEWRDAQRQAHQFFRSAHSLASARIHALPGTARRMACRRRGLKFCRADAGLCHQVSARRQAADELAGA